jgi:hypothetical protein
VLSFSFAWWLLFATCPTVTGQVLDIVYRVIATHPEARLDTHNRILEDLERQGERLPLLFLSPSVKGP